MGILSDVVKVGTLGLVDLDDDGGGSAAAKASAKASEKAAKIQAKSAREALDRLEGLTQSYREFGESALPGYQQFIDDPSGYSFLQNNPMFNAALDYSTQNMQNAAAARGKTGGGLTNALFQNYLALGDQYTNSAANRLLSPIQIGANASSLQGQAGSNLLTGAANAQASGIVGAANAQAAGQQNSFNNLLGVRGLALGLGALALSDERTKEDIEHIGDDIDGNPLYEYSYKHESKPKYVGYMAQDIAETDPQNVLLGPDGYLRVTERYAPLRIS